MCFFFSFGQVQSEFVIFKIYSFEFIDFRNQVENVEVSSSLTYKNYKKTAALKEDETAQTSLGKIQVQASID